ncbi:hypothetical protein Pmar_PMAR004738 [Perkinsus marinus ATCC 50983]|uniref:PPM-type phosphatase domain-containing protein n=1 Tax=Perkinsus marinus (strain ATCC 50983 / TXsc) TaxID=423536 RepID=C5KF84_PERM5|nr:hypothetical protein Pmar_PMAR004738 [Perkinsus marinus ATCC 50983]EER16886.1 hypothetical protein Pmar_PMAR004738 [Perkinsus marinus ATCC 50983]|eukprot:XP_002785090.1 hypothetical protein Pmar_PMAR004738 [Perkinsus marinus ATCC 50983]
MKASATYERRRISQAGGNVSDGRVAGVLEPSRTIGDFDVKMKIPPDVISITPEVRCVDLLSTGRGGSEETREYGGFGLIMSATDARQAGSVDDCTCQVALVYAPPGEGEAKSSAREACVQSSPYCGEDKENSVEMQSGGKRRRRRKRKRKKRGSSAVEEMHEAVVTVDNGNNDEVISLASDFGVEMEEIVTLPVVEEEEENLTLWRDKENSVEMQSGGKRRRRRKRKRKKRGSSAVEEMHEPVVTVDSGNNDEVISLASDFGVEMEEIVSLPVVEEEEENLTLWRVKQWATEMVSSEETESSCSDDDDDECTPKWGAGPANGSMLEFLWGEVEGRSSTGCFSSELSGSRCTECRSFARRETSRWCGTTSGDGPIVLCGAKKEEKVKECQRRAERAGKVGS